MAASKETESYDLLGITLEGAQAQMGQLISNQLRYEMAFRQLRALHSRNLNSIKDCTCGVSGLRCETRKILNVLEEMNGLKL